VRIADPEPVLEGNAGTTTVVFQISLEKASALPVTVSYASADGTALAGSDFESSGAHTAHLRAGRDEQDCNSECRRRHRGGRARGILGRAVGTDQRDDRARRSHRHNPE
jgi:hypothetical protein